MFNFDQLVKTLLTEAYNFNPPFPQPLPTWFETILQKHKDLGLGEITENDVKKIFNIVFKNYVSEQDAASVGKHIRILDILKTIYDSTKQKPNKNIDSFFKNQDINANGDIESKTILQYNNKNQWELQNALVANAYKPGAKTKERIEYATQAFGALAGLGGVGDIYGGVR